MNEWQAAKNPNCRGKETQRVCRNILKYSFLQRLRKMPWAHVRE